MSILHLRSRTRIRNHFPQLKLLGEFSAELSQIRDELLRARDHGLFWGDAAVRLDAELDLGEKRMWDCSLLVWYFRICAVLERGIGREGNGNEEIEDALL